MDDNVKSSTIDIPIPRKNLGCQDNLTNPNILIKGHLRRKSIFQDIIGHVDKLNVFKWPRNYVIVLKDCLYCYKDETDDKATFSVSLYGFKSVEICELSSYGSITWPFKIINALNEKKHIYFSAASYDDRQLWIENLSKEIQKANNKFSSIECKPIAHIERVVNRNIRQQIRQLPAVPKSNDSDSDIKDDYTEPFSMDQNYEPVDYDKKEDEVFKQDTSPISTAKFNNNFTFQYPSQQIILPKNYSTRNQYDRNMNTPINDSSRKINIVRASVSTINKIPPPIPAKGALFTTCDFTENDNKISQSSGSINEENFLNKTREKDDVSQTSTSSILNKSVEPKKENVEKSLINNINATVENEEINNLLKNKFLTKKVRPVVPFKNTVKIINIKNDSSCDSSEIKNSIEYENSLNNSIENEPQYEPVSMKKLQNNNSTLEQNAFCNAPVYECEKMLKTMGVGTYMLRESSSITVNNQLTLLVNVDEKTMVKYKILNLEYDKVSIKTDHVSFPNVSSLIKYYIANSLPDRSVKLFKSYKELL